MNAYEKFDGWFANYRAYYGDINFFGGPSSTSVKASSKLRQLAEENEDAMFIFVSDVWLDSVEVLEKIHTMFSGDLMPSTSFHCESNSKYTHCCTYSISSNILILVLCSDGD